jgi:hypothetical protein
LQIAPHIPQDRGLRITPIDMICCASLASKCFMGCGSERLQNHCAKERWFGTEERELRGLDVTVRVECAVAHDSLS